MRNRNIRLIIDVVFLALSLTFIWQDARSDDRWGLVFWGVSLVVWVVAIASDARRPVDTNGDVIPRSAL